MSARPRKPRKDDTQPSPTVQEIGVFEVCGVTYYVLEESSPSTALEEGGLTTAEREVVAGVLAGLSNNAIAERRRCSRRTVENQLASAYRKLGVGSRRELCAKLAREKLP